jgi:hypothetical protein
MPRAWSRIKNGLGAVIVYSPVVVVAGVVVVVA